MTTPTSAALIQAASDRNITARLVALGRQGGATEQDILDAIPRLVGVAVTEAGDTIASVLDYAVTTYEPTPLPGANPAAVTDAYLVAALTSLGIIRAESGDGPA